MAKLKNQVIQYRDRDSDIDIRQEFGLYVSADKGDFYAYIPEALTTIYNAAKVRRDCKQDHRKRDCLRLTSDSLENLVGALKEVLASTVSTVVTYEYVIRFLIYTDCVHATHPDGRIAPNCYGDDDSPNSGFEWCDESRFGEISANRSLDGFELVIGAEVFKKTITTHDNGDVTEIYSRGSDAGPQAERLNSWAHIGITEPDDYSYSGRDVEPREIPYSDEAAAFFNSLIESMVRLAQRVQSAAFLQDDLQALIEKHAAGGGNLLEGPK